MTQFCSTTFPDEEYLQTIVEGEKRRAEEHLSLTEKLVMYSGAEMNSIGDAFSDPHMRWEKKELNVEELVLTRTNPEWNEVIIKRAEKSPVNLRKLMEEDPIIATLFAGAYWNESPILVRAESGYHVFDGMHRVVAAIRDNRKTVTAWVATPETAVVLQPACEPHIIYDFLRAYQRGSNLDRDGLIAALKFLKKAYGNVGPLLKDRFGPEWIPDEELQSIIAEVLQE
ncbi:MAG: hypothetical protein AAB431_03915 [Patescibacteria group bacterium]